MKIITNHNKSVLVKFFLTTAIFSLLIIAQSYSQSPIKLNHGIKFANNNNSKALSLEKVENDTVRTNSIINIWNNNDIYNVRINIRDKDSEVEIGVFNMLGKEVMKVFKGIVGNNEAIYEFNADKLPNGVYLCVLQGRNFRDVEKFVVSR